MHIAYLNTYLALKNNCTILRGLRYIPMPLGLALKHAFATQELLYDDEKAIWGEGVGSFH